jgi:hypothetical protein
MFFVWRTKPGKTFDDWVDMRNIRRRRKPEGG